MALCPLTLKAIGCALNCEVSYICKISHLVDEQLEIYYICVGDSAFFFFDHSLDRVKGRVNYVDLQRIIVDIHVDSLLQIHLSEHRDRNMPLKMNILCTNRKTFIHFLSFSWKTNIMYHDLEIKELPIYQYDISLKEKSKLVTPGISRSQHVR